MAPLVKATFEPPSFAAAGLARGRYASREFAIAECSDMPRSPERPNQSGTAAPAVLEYGSQTANMKPIHKEVRDYPKAGYCVWSKRFCQRVPLSEFFHHKPSDQRLVSINPPCVAIRLIRFFTSDSPFEKMSCGSLILSSRSWRASRRSEKC